MADTIRDPAYGRRLSQACDSNPHCPPGYGRLTWIADQMGGRIEKKPSVENVSRWMKGVAKPRQKTNEALAKLIGVDPIWLYFGQEPDVTPRDRKLRNAEASGAVNVVAGFIRMDGGTPAFPDEDDARVQGEPIDLHAIIRGANYALHVSLAYADETTWRFPVPDRYEGVIMLGVVRGEGFAVRIIELTEDLLQARGVRAGPGKSLMIELNDAEIDERALASFAKRL